MTENGYAYPLKRAFNALQSNGLLREINLAAAPATIIHGATFFRTIELAEITAPLPITTLGKTTAFAAIKLWDFNAVEPHFVSRKSSGAAALMTPVICSVPVISRAPRVIPQ